MYSNDKSIKLILYSIYQYGELMFTELYVRDNAIASGLSLRGRSGATDEAI